MDDAQNLDRQGTVTAEGPGAERALRAVHYVMVPVPEELTYEVQRFLMENDMKARAPAMTNEHIDLDEVLALLPSLGERPRRALVILAAAAIADEPLALADLAMATGWPVHEASGVVHELNTVITRVLGPMMGVLPEHLLVPGAGALDWSTQSVVLWRELADAVTVAEARLAGTVTPGP